MIERGNYWHVRCDGCGEVQGDEENAYVVFDDLDKARRAAIAADDLTIEAGSGLVTCGDCRAAA